MGWIEWIEWGVKAGFTIALVIVIVPLLLMFALAAFAAAVGAFRAVVSWIVDAAAWIFR